MKDTLLNACDFGAFCLVLGWITAAAPWVAGALSGIWLAFRAYNEVMKAIDKKHARGYWFKRGWL